MNETEFLKRANKALVGKTITKVELLSSDDAKDIDWYERPVVIWMGPVQLVPLMDPEGNGPGAIDTNIEVDGHALFLGPWPVEQPKENVV